MDDHEVVRVGLRHLLNVEPGLLVVSERGRIGGTLEEVRLKCPDIVLLDLRLPDGDGLDLCATIKRESPQIKVVILTSYLEPTLMMRAIAAGADGYLLKESESTELSKALRLVRSGGSFFDPIGRRSISSSSFTDEPGKEDLRESLTGHESRLLKLVAKGETNKEIGEQLKLSEKTVRNQLSVVFTKLNVTNRTQAASVYLRLQTQAVLPKCDFVRPLLLPREVLSTAEVQVIPHSSSSLSHPGRCKSSLHSPLNFRFKDECRFKDELTNSLRILQ